MIDSSDNVDNDFEYARQTYHDILVKGSAALEDMIEVARSTEHPRAFEVLSGLMKTMADVNGNLLDLHKKKKDIKKEDPSDIPAGGITNNLLVGSTVEIQKMLSDLQKKEGDVIDVLPDKD
jgi:hypothetical protein|tara:strand:+ start:2769 stop:3131 length:363 start_codon:yes stop_codon:yes gene_type:complete